MPLPGFKPYAAVLQTMPIAYHYATYAFFSFFFSVFYINPFGYLVYPRGERHQAQVARAMGSYFVGFSFPYAGYLCVAGPHKFSSSVSVGIFKVCV